MTSSLVTLFGARTSQQVLTSMYGLAATLGVDVVGVQAERLFRSLFEIEAAEKANEDALRVKVAQAGFLDTVKLAGTAWVDLIAQGWFGLPRAAATYTVGLAVLTCGALAVSGTVPARQARFQSSTGLTFTNAEAFTVKSNSTVPVILMATVAGSTGNVPVGLTWTNTTTIVDCTLTNPGTSGSWITSAGVDAESDDSLLARCAARWAATSYGGAASAYRQWVADAFAAAGISNTITRIGVDDGNPNGPGSTDIYLANVTGPADASELALVNTYLQARRSLGTGPLQVLASPALSVTVVATLYGNTDGVALATAALLELQATLPLGGTVYFSELLATLKNIPGVYHGAMSSPAPGVDVDLINFDVGTFSPTIAAVA